MPMAMEELVAAAGMAAAVLILMAVPTTTKVVAVALDMYIPLPRQLTIRVDVCSTATTTLWMLAPWQATRISPISQAQPTRLVMRATALHVSRATNTPHPSSLSSTHIPKLQHVLPATPISATWALRPN